MPTHSPSFADHPIQNLRSGEFSNVADDWPSMSDYAGMVQDLTMWLQVAQMLHLAAALNLKMSVMLLSLQRWQPFDLRMLCMEVYSECTINSTLL